MASIRKQLKRARDRERLIRVVRRKGWLDFDGYVVNVGKAWFELVLIQDAQYAGNAILRLEDVRRLAKPQSNALMTARVLEHEDAWPPRGQGADLKNARTLVTTSAFHHRVMSFAQEGHRPGTFDVGNVHHVGKRWVDAWEISPVGRWGDEAEFSIRLDRLTKLVVRDPYVEKITEVADAYERR